MCLNIRPVKEPYRSKHKTCRVFIGLNIRPNRSKHWTYVKKNYKSKTSKQLINTSILSSPGDRGNTVSHNTHYVN